MRKTALFLLGGFGLFLLGAAVQPRFVGGKVEPESQRILFPELADATKAASLEIVSFDEELATLKPFKVVQTNGVWSLPSHDNYPADAREQLAAAATELVDRPILSVAGTSQADHATYGVIEPNAEKLKVGESGVGRLIEIRDAGGNKLARLIVGMEAKGPAGAAAAPGRTLRYVRKAGQDPTYVMEIDLSKYSTKFDDWIEKDLLKLLPWDLRSLVLDDSTWSVGLDAAERPTRVVQERRSSISLGYDDKDSSWSLAKLEVFGPGNKPQEEKLAADEELATGKLNDLRQALGDLKIVDVLRKPAGLSGELKGDAKVPRNQEAFESLAVHGFYPLESGAILSSNGETVVGMKDGVEYTLRFGNGTSVSEEEPDAAAPADGKEPSATGGKTGRYLFVTARFNEALLEKPELEPLPDVPAVPGGSGEAAGADKDDKAEKKDADDASAQLKAADEAEAKAQEALEERRRVERENRRRQDDYDEKVKAAQKRVRELNGRFADWYYVVSEAEYAKIHLGRAGVVQKKSQEPAADAGAGT